MKYLCLICAETMMEQMPAEDAKKHFQEYAEFTKSSKNSGHFIGAYRLKPSDTAITVLVREGKFSTTDGMRSQKRSSPRSRRSSSCGTASSTAAPPAARSLTTSRVGTIRTADTLPQAIAPRRNSH